MLRDIYRVVVVERVVGEPFSAKLLAPHMPLANDKRIAAYLRLHATNNARNRNAYFIRYFRGWYCFNYLRLEDIAAAGK